MAQVKKEAVREAILEAAFRLFRQQGYLETTLQEIAVAARISRANIYVYFHSKFDLLYAAFHPWLAQRLDALEAELAAMGDPRARMRRILTALWRDIPGEANGFANNLMQALSTAAADESYSPELLHLHEKRVATMIERCLPPQRGDADSRALAHILFMAFDGFSMHAHLRSGEACSDAVIDAMTMMVFGQSGAAAPIAAAPAAPSRRARRAG